MSVIQKNANMTSATSPSPYVVTSNGFYSSAYADWKAFNGTATGEGDSWYYSGMTGWIQYDFSVPTKVSEYKITPRNYYGGATDNGGASSPRNFTIQGSNDGVNYTDLDVRTNVTDWVYNQSKTFYFSKPETYRYIKLNITHLNGASYIGMGGLQYYGEEDIEYIDGEDRINSLLTVRKKINETATLEGSIYIPPNNKMSGEVEIIGSGDSDLTSSIAIKRHYNINSNVDVYSDSVVDLIAVPPKFGSQRRSSFFIPYRSDIQGEIQLYSDYIVNGMQKKSSVSVKPRSDLSSIVRIKPHNRMSAIIEIIEPPRVTLDVAPEKDVFIREAVPTLNYGTEQTMLVGYSTGYNEKYRSLIHFSMSGIPQDNNIDLARIRLYNSTPIIGSPFQIGLYQTANNNWTELGTTWANQPQPRDLIKIVDIDRIGEFNIDITDFVKSVYIGEELNNGIIIKPMSDEDLRYISLFTKESSNVNLRPLLTVKYYDETIYNYGRLDRSSSLTVIGLGNSDIVSSLFVPQVYGEDNLTSSITVKNPSVMPSYISVTKDKIVGDISVRQTSMFEVESDLTVRMRMVNDISSFIVSSKPNLPSELEIKYYDEVESSIAVRRSDRSQMDSSLSVSKDTMNSSLNINFHENLDSDITVRRYYEYAIHSNLAVTREKIESSIYVRYRDDLDSSISVRESAISDIDSSMAVSRREVTSSAYVRYHENLDSNVKVRRSALHNMPSSLAVSRREINTTIYVRPFKNLDSEISVRVSDNYDLPSNLVVSRPVMNGSLIVRVSDNSNVDSDVSIRISDNSDKISHISVSRRELASHVNVVLMNNINGTLTVRRNENRSLNSNLIIPYRIEIDSDVEVTNAHMLESSIFVISGNLVSYITIPNQAMIEINSSVTARIKFINDLTSSLKIGSDDDGAYAFIL